jgi:hypothetical protein
MVMSGNEPSNVPVFAALGTVLREIVDGTAPEAFLLNQGDRGLLASLELLSAEAASAVPAAGGATIAAHVDHLRYGLGLMNRWSRGENPFADADYSASWRRQQVSPEQWRELLDGLRRETRAWVAAASRPRDIAQTDLAVMIASAAHMAYHLGAIRQIDRTAVGPPAGD